MEPTRTKTKLFSRGWTLQEEVLSPRFLTFQLRQTSLRMGDTVYHESGLTQKITETSFLHTDGIDVRTWTKLVEDYSQRLLTREGDKLPALSGVAQLYQERFNSTYLAGLWLSHLLEHLCWCVPSGGAEAHRPSEYRAPSWSWASLDGKVVFDNSLSLGVPSRQINLLQAKTTPTGQDPLGQVRDGSIRLEAELSKQYWKRDPNPGRKWYYAHPTQEPFIFSAEKGGVTTPFSNATLLLDIQDPTIEELELWSLPIHDQFALALQVVDPGKNTFRRIGAICWRSKKDDGDKSVSSIITIVLVYC